jgi:diaminohydroxyphosphoribosylaminopyrimidine deaminase / 5-amino-6-(5-phosphoribosylamino)uracil reductase
VNDIDHMRHALALGRRSMGATGANPAVGCVLVKDDHVVGVGWTAEGGAPHAETRALAMAGDLARGATAYVTLEPCSHDGRTPPCAAALAKAGIARVISASEDPDPRVSGNGHALLCKAGVKVQTGLLENEARMDMAGFFSRIRRGRPHVVMKLALSSDGMITEAKGVRTAITGEEANARTHLMRAQADAIMVGVGTVRTDDPVLTCRLPGLEHRSPQPIIVDGRLATPLSARLVADAYDRGLIILTGPVAEGTDIEKHGVMLLRCRETAPGRIDLAQGLEQLGRRGINRLLVEGGADLVGQLVKAALVDELAVFTAAKALGPAGVAADLVLTGFEETGTEKLGQDRLAHYRKRDVGKG